MSKIQPQEIDYVDTMLVECSKLRSSELNRVSPEDDDYAIFSNEQSVGIKIEEGDTISMASAFVSEVGAGGQVIEFTAKPKTSSNPNENVKYKTTATQSTKTGDVEFTSNGYNPYTFEFTTSIPYLMNDYDLRVDQFSSNVETEHDVVDNELYFTVSYYKTTNGENYFHLPRRWANGADYTFIQHCYQYGNQVVGGTRGEEASVAYSEYSMASWMSWYQDPIGTVPRKNVPQYERSGQMIRNRGFPSEHQLARADHHRQLVAVADLSEGQHTDMNISKRNDNSKYKIYVRKRTFWYPDVETTQGYQSTIQEYNYDIALNEYIPFLETKHIVVERGFDTPSNVATTLTEQLNQTTTSRTVNVKAYNNVDSSAEGGTAPEVKSTPYTTITETELFKAFRSATESSFNQTSSRRYFCGNAYDGAENGGDDYLYNQSTLNYINSFHHIGVKRPEIYDAGNSLKGINESGDPILWNFTIAKTQATYASFVTNIPWDLTNPETGNRFLTDLKTLFDAEGLYPELFDYNTTFEAPKLEGLSVDTARYLHIQTAQRPDSPNQDLLGNDNWIFPDDIGREHYSGAIPNSACSSPIFIHYNPEQSENIDVESNGTNTDNLWGGFAYRFQVSGVDYIAFTNTGLTLFEDDMWDGDDEIKAGQRTLGYDRHWSAYGTSCIGLYSGKTFANYIDWSNGNRFGIINESTGTPDSGTLTKALTRAYVAQMTQDRFMDLGNHVYYNGFDMFPFTYIGAPEPIVNFDTQVNRFSIGGLYSPEHIGNFIQAGVTYNDNPYSKADSPQQQVYYINKQLKSSSFCPDMVPYTTTYTEPNVTDLNSGWTQSQTDPYNHNLDKYVVFDKFSGVTWESFGPDQQHWLQNSLLGLLGFRYKDLNPESPLSFQTSYSTNKYNPNTRGITTGALIENSSILSRTLNQADVALYNYLTPSAPGLGITLCGITNHVAYIPQVDNIQGWSVQLPRIVENTSTAFVRASNLPKKTTRPYYLIRSDIIQQENYVASEGQRLPVIGIVNKINGDSDFFTNELDGVEFTATRPYVINKITTSIHTPSGEFATVDENSAVIYKIKKKKKMISNLAELMIQQTQS